MVVMDHHLRPLVPLLLLVWAAGLSNAHAQPQPACTDPATRALIEADWLEQKQANLTQGAGKVTTQEDAAGAVDGVINGEYGFHCASRAPDSWWQVDLGQRRVLDRVVVYNRCRSAGRASTGLVMLGSDDGKTWREIYQHDGTVFRGFTDKKPLVVSFRDKSVAARFVRLQMKRAVSFHLDEVQVYAQDDPKKNIALGQPADQSSTSRYSTRKVRPGRDHYTMEDVHRAIESGRRLIEQITRLGGGNRVRQDAGRLDALAKKSKTSPKAIDALYHDVRWVVRSIALKNPLLDFDKVLFVKRHPGTLPHMCDQYFGSFAQPGGGVYALEDLGGDFRAREVIGQDKMKGSFLSPDLSYDGRRIVFAHSRATADRKRGLWTPEVCYHLFAVKLDGTGLRQLTDGPHDDIDPRFLPDGDLVFISTRRGGFCRCGGRPVPTYTLHKMSLDAPTIHRLSPHETNEWHPSVLNDGSLIYTRWDYVDRHTNVGHGLWTARSDGSNAMAFYGNYNFGKRPWGVWHPRAIPGSRKILGIAGGHHGYAEGSVVLIDLDRGQDGLDPLTRITPEVAFPESEGWPLSNYTTAWPLSEDFYLLAYSPRWSSKKLRNGLTPGLYLLDRWGHRELLYRDPAIPSESPIPLRSRPLPTARPRTVDWAGERTGRFLLYDVTQSTEPMESRRIRKLRVVQILPKTMHRNDHPKISVARQLSARFLLGTVPVEEDGSAYFEAPASVPLYFQAVDDRGMAYQSMRTITYVQPGETLSCVGCHEPRHTAPPNRLPMAARRAPSKIERGPDGTKPVSYLRLVQPVLDKHCVKCHSGPEPKKGIRLTGKLAKDERGHCESYRTLATRKRVHWFNSVNGREWLPRTYPGTFGAQASPLVQMLRAGHNDVQLGPEELRRICIWIDLNVPFYGVYQPEHVAAQRRGEVVPLDEILQ